MPALDFTAFDLVPDAMVVVDADGRIVAVNGLAENLFGYPEGELVGQPLERLLPHRFRASHAGHRAAYTAAPQPRRMGTGLALWARRADGGEFPADISLSPVESAQERFIVAAIRDVSAQKAAEAARLQLAAIVESSDDAIIAKDLGGTILSWNRGAERIYGYGADEVIGRPVAMLAPPEREDEVAMLLAAIARGEPVDHYETVRRRKDGTLIDVSMTISPIRDPRGSIVGASTIARDVTDRKRLDALRREFIVNAAHELRTPLATLTGLAEVLAQRYHEMAPATIDQSLEVLRRQGERAGLLIANLIELAGLERGAVAPEPERLALVEVLPRIVEATPPPEETTLTSAVDPDAAVVADRVRLGRIVTHLLTNAYRYGGPQVRIEAHERDGWAVIAVSDDGPGVPARFVTELFEPFTRAVDTSHPLGSGIGLAVCRRLAETMGGQVRYEPGRPAGARFLLSLPAPGPRAPH